MNSYSGLFVRELKLISSENIKRTFKVLGVYLVDSSDYYNDYTTLYSQYNRLKKEIDGNRVKSDDSEIRLNRIGNSLISLLDNLSEVDFNKNYKDWLIQRLETKIGTPIESEFKKIDDQLTEINSKVDEAETDLLGTRKLLRLLAIGAVVSLIVVALSAYIIQQVTRNAINNSMSEKISELQGKIDSVDNDFPTVKVGTYKFEDEKFVASDTLKQVILEFWTPSPKTKYHLQDYTPEYKTTRDVPLHYYVSNNEVEIKDFIRELRNQFYVEGYSRFDAYGAGEEIPKPGYYWKMTVGLDGIKGYSKEKFLEVFKKVWHRDHGIFVIETYIPYDTNTNVE